MATKKPTLKEVSQSLTGFDEIAIKQKFSTSLAQLSQDDATQFARALAFVLERRDGKNDAEAYHIVQTDTLAKINARFREEDAEADFSEPPTTTAP